MKITTHLRVEQINKISLIYGQMWLNGKYTRMYGETVDLNVLPSIDYLNIVF